MVAIGDVKNTGTKYTLGPDVSTHSVEIVLFTSFMQPKSTAALCCRDHIEEKGKRERELCCMLVAHTKHCRLFTTKTARPETAFFATPFLPSSAASVPHTETCANIFFCRAQKITMLMTLYPWLLLASAPTCWPQQKISMAQQSLFFSQSYSLAK